MCMCVNICMLAHKYIDEKTPDCDPLAALLACMYVRVCMCVYLYICKSMRRVPSCDPLAALLACRFGLYVRMCACVCMIYAAACMYSMVCKIQVPTHMHTYIHTYIHGQIPCKAMCIHIESDMTYTHTHKQYYSGQLTDIELEHELHILTHTHKHKQYYSGQLTDIELEHELHRLELDHVWERTRQSRMVDECVQKEQQQAQRYVYIHTYSRAW
jgi:hypothetical protein